MSSKSTDKKYQKIPIHDLEEPLKLNNVIIPFSKFSNSEVFIYYGYEKMPFSERHPIFQAILKREFIESIKKLTNNSKN
ncbi:MAG: hypothetical protein ACFE9S_04300 [Candidatus Hermodarchaeota archaeon]